jgi:hypothetical protein
VVNYLDVRLETFLVGAAVGTHSGAGANGVRGSPVGLSRGGEHLLGVTPVWVEMSVKAGTELEPVSTLTQLG